MPKTAARAKKAPREEHVAPHERRWGRPWQPGFLRSLSLIPDVTSACRASNVSRPTVYRYREADAAFQEAWDEALEVARDTIQQFAHSWITTGVPVKARRTKTVKKTDAKGNVTETTTETVESESAERSATLMIFWLKAWYPDRYRWSERAEIAGLDGGPIRVESLDSIDRQIAQLTEELDARARRAGDEVPVEEERG